MKLTSFSIEVLTSILANQIGPNGESDHFQRDSTGALIFGAAWWHSAFCTAIDMLRMRGIKGVDIQMDLQVRAPTQIFARRYGDDHFRRHEAIMPGTQVTFTGIVADHVTEQMLGTLLDRIGKSIGLSPYGFKLGYGRFNVITCKVAPSDAAEST